MEFRQEDKARNLEVQEIAYAKSSKICGELLNDKTKKPTTIQWSWASYIL